MLLYSVTSKRSDAEETYAHHGSAQEAHADAPKAHVRHAHVLITVLNSDPRRVQFFSVSIIHS